MSASSIRAGEAFIELSTRDSELQKGLQRASAQLKSFGTACQSIGTSMMAMSGAMTAPFVLAVNAFKNFDTQMRAVKAKTQSTGKEFDSLTKKARQIGKETSYTAKQVAEAMTALGQNGFKAPDIEMSIASVMDLARATGTDLASAADIAANSLRIFSLDASQMTTVADVLTATANGSAQTLTELFDAISKSGRTAYNAKASIVDVAASLGIMANMGIKGAVAGTALNKAYLQFANPKVREYLRGFNVETVDSNKNLRKMQDIMIDLSRVMQGMGTAEKLTFAQNVFDIRGMTGGLSLSADIAQNEAFARSLDDCTGAARRTREEMEAGLGGTWDRLVSALSDVGISVGKIVSESLIPLMESLTNTINSFGDWIVQNKELVKVVAGATAAVFAMGSALVAIGVAMKAFAAILSVATVGAVAFKAALVAVTAAAATPIGLCVLAAGAVGTLAYALQNAGDQAEATSDQMQKLAESNASARAQDQAKADRLKEIATRQKRANAEMKEAKSIATELESKYGKLGLTFNDTANSIGNLADAMEKLNRSMEKQELADIENQLAEHRKNIESATEIENSWIEKFFRGARELGRRFGDTFGAKYKYEAPNFSQTPYIAEQQKKISALEARKAEILSGNARASSVRTSASVLGTGDLIKDKETLKAEAAFLKERADFAADQRRLNESRADAQTQRSINKAVQRDPVSAVRMLQDLVSRFEGAARLAAAEYSKALSEAANPDADGIVRYTDEEKIRVREARQNYEQSERRVDNYREQLLRVNDGLEKNNRTAFGSWSSDVLNAILGGGGSAADRTANATEQSVALQKKANKKLDKIAGSSGLVYN